MVEREPGKEIIGKGDLFFLWHPGTEQTFSGYGLTMQPGSTEFLTGLLMVDRPRPVDPEWLKEVEATFGECHLVAMAAGGERGIACQMQIEPDSLPYLVEAIQRLAVRTIVPDTLIDVIDEITVIVLEHHIIWERYSTCGLVSISSRNSSSPNGRIL